MTTPPINSIAVTRRIHSDGNASIWLAPHRDPAVPPANVLYVTTTDGQGIAITLTRIDLKQLRDTAEDPRRHTRRHRQLARRRRPNHRQNPTQNRIETQNPRSNRFFKAAAKRPRHSRLFYLPKLKRTKVSRMAGQDKIPPVPKGSGPSGRALWRDVLGKYDLEEHEMALLREAVRTVDDLDGLHAVVAAEGMTVGYEGASGPGGGPAVADCVGAAAWCVAPAGRR